MPVTTNGLTTVSATSVAVSGDSTYSGNLAIGGSFVSGAANVNGSAAFAGDVWVAGNLHLVGNTLITNVAYQTSDAVNVTNYGTGPALVVYQGGNWPIASFADQYGTALFIGNNACVSVGSSVPPTSGNVLRVAGSAEFLGNVNASGWFIGNGAMLTGLNQQWASSAGGLAYSGNVSVGNLSLGTANTALFAPAAQLQSKYRYAGATKTTDTFWVGTGAAPSTGGVLQYSSNSAAQSTNMWLEWGNTGVLGGTLSINYRDYAYGLNSIQSFGTWTHTGALETSSLVVDSGATIVGNLSLSSGKITANLFNSTSGSVTLSSTQTTLFTVPSGTSGLLVIQPTSATLTKGLWFFEYSSGSDYCSVTQLAQSVGGSITITCTAGSNYINAAINSGTSPFTWRVLML